MLKRGKKEEWKSAGCWTTISMLGLKIARKGNSDTPGNGTYEANLQSGCPLGL